MPRINVKTNSVITEQQQRNMMGVMKKLIDLIPYEDGSLLMADFEGECAILFGEDISQPCAAIEISLYEPIFHKVDNKVHEAVLRGLTEVVSETLAIAPDRIFAFYKNGPVWLYDKTSVGKLLQIEQ